MGPHHCCSGMPLPESQSVDLVDLAILLPPSSRTVLLPMFSGKARLPGEALEVGTFMTTLRDKEPRLASALQSRPDRTIIVSLVLRKGTMTGRQRIIGLGVIP